MALEGIYLDIDISQVQHTLAALRMAHSEKEFRTVVYRAIKKTGSRVRSILKQELPKEYRVTSTWVGSQVRNPRTSFGGGGLGVSCSIPVVGSRGSIGGRFGASGGAHGWNSKNRKYRIKARILAKEQSTLPSAMKRQGGNPPFRNLSAGALNGVAFTRKGKERLPIAPVVGLGVPQMPMNRSQDDVQERIATYLNDRLVHEHAFLISKCR